MSMTGLCVLAMSVCAAAPVLAQPPAAPPAAPQARGNSPAASVVSPEINWRNYLNEFVPQLFQ